MNTVLISVLNNIQPITYLVTALCYLIGMYIIISNIIALKDSATLSAPNQGQVSTFDVIKKIFIGAAILYLPSVIDTASQTFFGANANATGLGYIPDNSEYEAFIDMALKALGLIGLIAVARGLYTLGYGHYHDGVGPVSRAIAYIIGGALCLNIEIFLRVIFITLGID